MGCHSQSLVRHVFCSLRAIKYYQHAQVKQNGLCRIRFMPAKPRDLGRNHIVYANNVVYSHNLTNPFLSFVEAMIYKQCYPDEPAHTSRLIRICTIFKYVLYLWKQNRLLLEWTGLNFILWSIDWSDFENGTFHDRYIGVKELKLHRYRATYSLDIFYVHIVHIF